MRVALPHGGVAIELCGTSDDGTPQLVTLTCPTGSSCGTLDGGSGSVPICVPGTGGGGPPDPCKGVPASGLCVPFPSGSWGVEVCSTSPLDGTKSLTNTSCAANQVCALVAQGNGAIAECVASLDPVDAGTDDGTCGGTPSTGICFDFPFGGSAIEWPLRRAD